MDYWINVPAIQQFSNPIILILFMKFADANLPAYLRSNRVPPLEYWPFLFDSNIKISQEYKDVWKSVWKGFKAHILSNPNLKSNLKTKIINSYFRVMWQQSKRTGKEKVSGLENRWWLRLKKEFPKKKILRHVQLPSSRMHLDIFFQESMLAVEIQGDLHWRAVPAFGGAEALAGKLQNDADKRKLCKKFGVKLIEVSKTTPIEKVLKEVAELLITDNR